ncbi:hypothetical protein HK098_001490 [Nowakowskiella sp. JEL0407]|nr:hypothetical protein HK098_001490 [Nowakowskiella sp. JEL0407]
MSESRTELLSWVNDLLSLDLTKIEQCGTGAVYCQIFDSVHGTEYDSVARRAKSDIGDKKLHSRKTSVNTNKPQSRPALPEKEEQSPPSPHAIQLDTVIESESEKTESKSHLRKTSQKTSFADSGNNKKSTAFVDSGTKKGTTSTSYQPQTSPQMQKKPLSSAANFSQTSPQNQRKTPVSGTGVNLKSRGGHATNEITITKMQWESMRDQIYKLTSENAALKKSSDELIIVAESLEKERNFYFSKLREIEIVVRERLEKIQIDRAILPLLNSIQGIMYKTEDGFISMRATEPSNLYSLKKESSFTQNILNAIGGTTFNPQSSYPPFSTSIHPNSGGESRIQESDRYGHNFASRPESAKLKGIANDDISDSRRSSLARNFDNSGMGLKSQSITDPPHSVQSRPISARYQEPTASVISGSKSNLLRDDATDQHSLVPETKQLEQIEVKQELIAANDQFTDASEDFQIPRRNF